MTEEEKETQDENAQRADGEESMIWLCVVAIGLLMITAGVLL